MSTSSTVTGPARGSGYRAVLGRRHVARLLGGTLIGRLPTGMAPIAILLLVRAEGGSLALAGLLSALFGLAAAVGQPLLGRMVDRHGQTRVLVGAASAATTAFLLLPCASPTRHPVLAALAVVVAGLSTPPLEASLMIERVQGSGEASVERVACGVGTRYRAVGQAAGRGRPGGRGPAGGGGPDRAEAG